MSWEIKTEEKMGTTRYYVCNKNVLNQEGKSVMTEVTAVCHTTGNLTMMAYIARFGDPMYVKKIGECLAMASEEMEHRRDKPAFPTSAPKIKTLGALYLYA